MQKLPIIIVILFFLFKPTAPQPPAAYEGFSFKPTVIVVNGVEYLGAKANTNLYMTVPGLNANNATINSIEAPYLPKLGGVVLFNEDPYLRCRKLDLDKQAYVVTRDSTTLQDLKNLTKWEAGSPVIDVEGYLIGIVTNQTSIHPVLP